VGQEVGAGGPLRAVFRDAGNTLVEVDYGRIAAALEKKPGGRRRWPRCGRPGPGCGSTRTSAPSASTESADAVLLCSGYLLDGLGAADRAEVARLAAELRTGSALRPVDGPRPPARRRSWPGSAAADLAGAARLVEALAGPPA
jgi:hypothetical protein